MRFPHELRSCEDIYLHHTISDNMAHGSKPGHSERVCFRDTFGVRLVRVDDGAYEHTTCYDKRSLSDFVFLFDDS